MARVYCLNSSNIPKISGGLYVQNTRFFDLHSKIIIMTTKRNCIEFKTLKKNFQIYNLERILLVLISAINKLQILTTKISMPIKPFKICNTFIYKILFDLSDSSKMT